MSHELTASHGGRRPKPPKWPSYTGVSHLVGTSPHGRVTVYVDPSLGAPALQNANDLLADADRVVAANNKLFGTPGGPTNVIVFALGGATDGTGGADHMGCDYTTGENIEVCASFGSAARVSALFEAELSECSMGGNVCGISTGEALSRWCAAVISNNALSDFVTAPQWVADGMPDFVNQTDPTDQNATSTGCGMVFLSWLMSQGQGLDKIAQTLVSFGDSGTLANLYAQLTSKPASQAWPAFQTAIAALSNTISNDDPFGTTHISALGHVAPPNVALAGTIFAGILADLSAGKAAEQIVETVRAAMLAAPAAKALQAPAGTCRPGSRRLLPTKYALAQRA
jgi:hypothetical protein